MDFLFNISIRESDINSLQTKGSASSNNTIFSNGDILSDKYVIIGVILFFVLLFIIAFLMQILKLYGGDCCQGHVKSDVYTQLTTSEDEEDDALDDIDYNNVNSMYTDCRLCVNDTEINTSSESLDIVKGESDFEYDCSSLSNSVVGLEQSCSNSVVGLEQSISNSEERVLTRSMSLKVSSKIASVFGRRLSNNP